MKRFGEKLLSNLYLRKAPDLLALMVCGKVYLALVIEFKEGRLRELDQLLVGSIIFTNFLANVISKAKLSEIGMILIVCEGDKCKSLNEEIIKREIIAFYLGLTRSASLKMPKSLSLTSSLLRKGMGMLNCLSFQQASI